MGFTIKELISAPELAGLRLVAGAKGANNLIRNASVVDCPDGFDWMLPGDFVLSSGYIFRDDPEQQRKLVRKLSELACAGIGIKEDELPFVKEKFYKGSSKQRGSGIGLAVTDEIVRMHGGTLNIASTYGEGTTVTISLPLANTDTKRVEPTETIVADINKE